MSGAGGTRSNLLVEADELTIAFHTPRGATEAVRDISFTVGRERVGIVGELGAGKSTLGRALMGLLPETARIDARRFSFEGEDLLTMPATARRALRGRRMAMILQDPRHALNPVITVGAQISETLTRHTGLNAKESRARGRALLASVRIADPERVWRAYAHELSGGLAQRAMIAMMLAPGPELLIADEATSALDVMAREQVLAVLAEQQRARGMGLLMISHDLGLVARFCDRVLVMRQGRVVEEATGDALAAGDATDPYTRHLLAVQPRLAAAALMFGIARRLATPTQTLPSQGGGLNSWGEHKMLSRLTFPSPLEGEGQGGGTGAATGAKQYIVTPASEPGPRGAGTDAGRPTTNYRASRPGRRIEVRRDDWGRGAVAAPP